MIPGVDILKGGQKLLAGTLQAIQDETRALRVGTLCNKQAGLTEREKSFIYNYIREGNLPEHLRIQSSKQQNLKIYEPIEDYQKNVIMLIESIFLYQFKPGMDYMNNGSNTRSSLSPQKNAKGQSQWDDEDYQEAQKNLGNITHFWQYMI